ncbi:selenoprotein BthD [Drosophila sulfurigaster albostrigata]|uniref:Selenoprotein BthD n=1 Tax=Drosophila albomicans TaxID=7291 RepID=A0A6P8W6I3_DROAB|nr:selenoprotein BthD [Drosophila albomicans]XP_062142688.1 selenoprotein BthD [Drosophila sulfurigaster albostrigata]
MKRVEATTALDPRQPVLYIEHCPVTTAYRKQAQSLHASLAEALRTMQPELKLQLRINENNAPRMGAFEVQIAARPTDEPQHRYPLWTGITRVPVTAKVPNVDDIIVPACLALRLRHSQAGASHINLVRTSDRDINKILQRDRRNSL